ncbi:tetratricopeptide repeat protein [Anaerolineales bacterium HSG24]|nr:tetratricopeptide repeat protein [Anaerolineales bacterium HSG24]
MAKRKNRRITPEQKSHNFQTKIIEAFRAIDLSRAFTMLDQMNMELANRPAIREQALQKIALGFIDEGSEEQRLVAFAGMQKEYDGRYPLWANLNDCGGTLYNEKLYETALKYYKQSLKTNSDNHVAWKNYGSALDKLGRYEEAIEKYQQAMKLDPKSTQAWYNYGNALNDLGLYEEAIEKYQQAINLDSKSTDAWNNYGNVLSDLGRYEEAIEKYQQTINLDPKSTDAWNGYGSALGGLGRYEEAIEKYQQAIKLDPKSTDAWNGYGSALSNLGHPEKAIEKYQQTIKFEPQNIVALSNYATNLIYCGQYNAAAEKLKQVRAIAPDDYATLWIQAMLLQKEGKYKEAIETLDAIEIDRLTPDNKNILYLSLGRLHYLNQSIERGREFFNLAIQQARDEDAARIRVADYIFADNPYSEEGVKILQEVAPDLPHHATVSRLRAINLIFKAHYELFNPPQEEAELWNTATLNRAFYHKIGNEVGVLKSMAQRIAYQQRDTNGSLAEIIDSIEDIPDGISTKRSQRDAEAQDLSKQAYKQLTQIISETAQDVSDFVNNELAVIESKVRRAMWNLSTEDGVYQQFTQLLTQLEHTQTALNDLKSINEGIVIRHNDVAVSELFTKWRETHTLENATITVEIRNPNSVFYGDAEKIKSALNELVENSIKHNVTQADLQIKIQADDTINPQGIRGQRLSTSQKFLLIIFSDNGKGIPHDKKDWVFLPLKTTSLQGTGSGLGLFIIKRTINKMNGYILETGTQGTTFKIYIPYLQGEYNNGEEQTDPLANR